MLIAPLPTRKHGREELLSILRRQSKVIPQQSFKWFQRLLGASADGQVE
jgi:hypothetical protein